MGQGEFASPVIIPEPFAKIALCPEVHEVLLAYKLKIIFIFCLEFTDSFIF